MGVHKTKKFLYSKENSLQIEEKAFRMEENPSQLYI
jgi:hypothetical protein